MVMQVLSMARPPKSLPRLFQILERDTRSEISVTILELGLWILPRRMIAQQKCYRVCDLEPVYLYKKVHMAMNRFNPCHA